MTVSYTDVAYSARFGLYLRLLFRYRGSIYKAAGAEFIIFAGLYMFVSLVYRLLLNDPSRRWMELCIISVSRIMNQIPIGFVLGFYVSLIYRRFWRSYLAIPSPTKTAIYLTTFLHGNDEEAVMMRRTAVRYVCAAFALAMRVVNIPIKKRFPTEKHISDAGLLTPEELKTYQNLQEKCKFHASFIPLLWSAAIARKALEKRKIKSTAALHDILRILDDFRSNCQTVFNYDQVNVPLCYTQAVTFGCYSYFAAGILGFQFIPTQRAQLLIDHGIDMPRGFNIDLYVPFFAIVQFLIYIGLMKVAEALLNPHGENDDDFEICNQVEKNLVNGIVIVKDMHNDLAELEEDKYFDIPEVDIPYTDVAYHIQKNRPNQSSHLGSLFNYSVKHGSQFLSTITRNRVSTNKPAKLSTSTFDTKELNSGVPAAPDSDLNHRAPPEAACFDQPDGLRVRTALIPEDSPKSKAKAL